jgi:hypothetical protein
MVLNQTKRAIEPSFPLSEMLNDWGNISKSLAESPRKRKIQLTRYFEYKKTS